MEEKHQWKREYRELGRDPRAPMPWPFMRQGGPAPRHQSAFGRGALPHCLHCSVPPIWGEPCSGKGRSSMLCKRYLFLVRDDQRVPAGRHQRAARRCLCHWSGSHRLVKMGCRDGGLVCERWRPAAARALVPLSPGE